MGEIDDSIREEKASAESKTRPGFTIPWPALTLTLLVVALASLGALIIVATIADADALATVALVLAILAFGAQLIVTAAQTASANEQYRQVNRLYEETRSVLQRIRAQSKMLLANQSDQFNKVLDHVLSPSAIESAVAEARGDADDPATPDGQASAPPTDVVEVSKLLRAEAERAISADRARRPAESPRRRLPDKEEMRNFPTEDEARDVAARFAPLSVEAKSYIKDLAERFNKNPDSSVSIQVARLLPQSISELPAYFKELEDAGLILLEPYRREGRSRAGRRLTSDGILAMRFFTGQGVVPAYLRPILEDEAPV